MRPPADPKPIEVFRLLENYDENVTDFRMRAVMPFFYAMLVVGMCGENRWNIPLVMAVVATLVYLWNRSDMRPYAWSSVVPIAAAGMLSLAWQLPAKSLEYIPLLIGGVWLLMQGCWTLIRFQRQNPEAGSLESAGT